MRKAIRDSWNNYMSRRRLDNFWLAFQTALANNETTDVLKDEALASFQECFLQMAKEAANHHSLEHSHSSSSGKTKPLAKNGIVADELDFFSYTEQYLPTVVAYLQVTTRCDKNWQDWQSSDRNLIDTLQCIQIFLKNGVQTQTANMKDAYDSVTSMIKFQMGHADKACSIKQLVKLLHLIFLYQQSQMVSFAKKGGFETVLGLLSLEDKAVTDTIIKYMAKWLQKERGELDEDSDDPERMESRSDFNNAKSSSYFKGILHNLTQKFNIDELNKDFAEDDQGQEETKNNSKSAQSQQNLAKDAANQLIKHASSNGALESNNPTMETRKILREGPFLEKLAIAMSKCSESNVLNYVSLLSILNCFSSQAFAAVSKVGVFTVIKDRFTSGQMAMHPVFDHLLQIANPKGSTKLKNQNLSELIFQIFESLVSSQKAADQDHIQLIVEAIKSLKHLFKESPHVSTIFLRQSSLERLCAFVIQTASTYDHGTLCPLLDLTMLLLYNLRDLSQSHSFAIAVSDLLLDQQKTETISIAAGKQLFHFLRLIIKDKGNQIAELVGEEAEQSDDLLTDQLIDIEDRLGHLLDKKLKQFVKQTFTLYFELSSKELWRVDCQMLLLCTLDLQEKLNQVAKQQSSPQPLSLFKESEDDTDMEQINFYETIKDLLLQREVDRVQDFINGFLAAKMTITLQDTPFLGVQDIRNLVKDLLDAEKDPGIFENLPSRTNPFIAMVFSSKLNCRAAELQDCFMLTDSEILKQLCTELEQAIAENKQELITKYLHRLILLSQNSLKYKQAIEKLFNFQQLVKDIKIRQFEEEAQLFILQCLLEMQADQVIYRDSIVSFEAILQHQCILSGEKSDYQEFIKVVKKVSQDATLKENDFDCNKGDSLIAQVQELDVLSWQSDQDRIEESDKAIIIGNLRENPLGFTLFLMVLGQASQSVQLEVLEDMCLLAECSLRNVRIMVQQSTQVFLLHMIKLSYEQKKGGVSKPHIGPSHSEYLVNLLSLLLSYGVCVPQNHNKDFLVECFGQKRKLNHVFVDQVTESLSTQSQQITGYTHFMEKQDGLDALKINGSAIGVSSWLLAPEVASDTLSAQLLSFRLSGNLTITIELLLEQKSSAETGNLNRGSVCSSGSDQDQEIASTPPKKDQQQESGSLETFILKICLLKKGKDRKLVTTKAVFRAELDDMVTLQVFHLQGFNHYVGQLRGSSGFDLFVNSHKVADGLFVEELNGKSLVSVDFAPLLTVANLSLIHSAVQKAKDIEQHRQSDFKVNQNELLGLPPVQIVTKRNFFVNLESRESNAETMTFTLHIPTSQSAQEQLVYKEMQVTLEEQSIEIPLLSVADPSSSSPQSRIEIFQDSDSLMTLKRYLSTEHAINAILELLDFAADEEATLKCLRLLASIIIQNHTRDSQDNEGGGQGQDRILSLFEKINGYARLEAILAKKLPEMHLRQVKKHFAQLIEIACDELNCSCRIDDRSNQSNGIRRPALYQSRIKFLQIGLNLVKNATVDQSNQFLEMVFTLLKNDDNLKVFREKIRFSAILELFRLVEQNYRFLGLYDITLALFELFISGVSRSDLQSFSEDDKKELGMIFEFLLSRDIERRLRFIKASQQLQSKTTTLLSSNHNSNTASTQNLILGSQKQNELVSRVIIDCLSIISIHILTETSCSSASSSVLLTKITRSIDLVNFILSLLQMSGATPMTHSYSTMGTQSKEDPLCEVREYALKFLQMLIFLSPDFRESFTAKGSYAVLADFVIQQGPKEGQLGQMHELEAMERKIIAKMPPYLVNHGNRQESANSKSSFNFNMVLLDAATQKFDNVYAMSPEKQTLVHTVMNRSRIAEQIVAQVKKALKRPKKVKIVYFGMITTFLKSLARMESDVSRYICLKHLHWLTIENEENLEDLLEDREKLYDFIEAVFQYKIDVLTEESNSNEDAEQRLLDMLASNSPNEEPQVVGALANRRQSRDERATNAIKSLDVAAEIIKDILVRDLERAPQLSQTYRLLYEFSRSEKSAFQYQVITKLLSHYQKNPKVNERNVIENLQKILGDLDLFVGTNPHVSMKAIILINTLALKSSNKFREQLKSLKLIELRDRLLIDQIRKTYLEVRRCVADSVQPSKVFISAICSLFSYGQLASKTIFAENCGTEYLTLVLLNLSELEKVYKTTTYYGDFARELRSRIKEEVMQFRQNDTSPELRAYFEGQGDADFFQRLYGFLSQKVARHIEAVEGKLVASKFEVQSRRNEIRQEKAAIEQSQVHLSREIQATLTQEFQSIFAKAQTSTH